jgi:hypothetical protein
VCRLRKSGAKAHHLQFTCKPQTGCTITPLATDGEYRGSKTAGDRQFVGIKARRYP